MMDKSFYDDLYNEITEEEVKELRIDLDNEQFKIVSKDQANFFLRQITELTKQKEEINENCDTMIESYMGKVNKFREKETTSIDRSISYFTTLLEAYAEEFLSEEKGKKKSIKLPFGTLQFKKTQASFNYGEEKNVLNFLKTAPNMEKYVATTVKESIDKKKLKADATIVDGQLYIGETKIPEIEVNPPKEKFSINLPK